MDNLIQENLGATLLSIAVFLGWLGLVFTLLRIIFLTIKKILEKVSNLSNKKN